MLEVAKGKDMDYYASIQHATPTIQHTDTTSIGQYNTSKAHAHHHLGWIASIDAQGHQATVFSLAIHDAR